MKKTLGLPSFLTLLLFLLFSSSSLAAIRPLENKPLYALSVYGGRMTDNSMHDFIDNAWGLDFENSYLVTLALSRRVATYKDLASFEVEGQLVKHFKEQDHWEFNALVDARWEKFFWDKYLDTSVAFGIGPSYATNIPEIEVKRSDDSSHLLVYLLLELEFVLPAYPDVAFITRVHHRSNAFGVVADSGTSNVFALGLKFRF